MRWILLLLVLLTLLSAAPDGHADDLDAALRTRVDVAIAEGLDWLAAQQSDAGAWSNEKFPALSALPLEAFAQSDHADRDAIVSNSCAFILSKAQKNGGIYRKSIVPGRGGLSTYNTAVCVSALHAVGDPAFLTTILKARAFLTESQLVGDDEHAGGFGYGQSSIRRSTDLMVSMHAVEAMYRTRDAEDSRASGETRAKLDAEKTLAYITQMQNASDAGDAEQGGFFYGPGKSGAGKTENAKGEVVFRSYGSMTYAGLLALIYTDVPRDDPRVKSAFAWSLDHWTLDENPGLGVQGMYFFYNVLAKALDTYGVNPLTPSEGEPINWKAALAEKLLTLQTRDADSGHAYWVNANGRYWENDPVLVTSYAIQALQRL
jgi:squalene-hopene/tetraprenyl-beta-curcumene cyclase